MGVKTSEIYEFIDSIAPFDTQESWDNSGFLIGDYEANVSKVAVCLDVTEDTIKKAIDFGADVIVSHHPVIFDPLKTVEFGTPVGMAIKNGINIISAHTNWDLAEGGVNDVLCGLLGINDSHKISSDPEEGLLRMGKLKTAVPAGEFAELVAEALDTVVRIALPDKLIQTVAVCGGSGASFLKCLEGKGIDAFITGDAKHNDFLDFISSDIALLAAGHYETETISMPVLMNLLKTEFPDLEYRYIESAPVTYVG